MLHAQGNSSNRLYRLMNWISRHLTSDDKVYSTFTPGSITKIYQECIQFYHEIAKRFLEIKESLLPNSNTERIMTHVQYRLHQPKFLFPWPPIVDTKIKNSLIKVTRRDESVSNFRIEIYHEFSNNSGRWMKQHKILDTGRQYPFIIKYECDHLSSCKIAIASRNLGEWRIIPLITDTGISTDFRTGSSDLGADKIYSDDISLMTRIPYKLMDNSCTLLSIDQNDASLLGTLGTLLLLSKVLSEFIRKTFPDHDEDHLETYDDFNQKIKTHHIFDIGIHTQTALDQYLDRINEEIKL